MQALFQQNRRPLNHGPLGLGDGLREALSSPSWSASQVIPLRVSGGPGLPPWGPLVTTRSFPSLDDSPGLPPGASCDTFRGWQAEFLNHQ